MTVISPWRLLDMESSDLGFDFIREIEAFELFEVVERGLAAEIGCNSRLEN